MKKVLFINQEITPYVPDTEMSLLGQQLPQAIIDKGSEIRTFMPKWGIINERRGQLHEVIRLSRMMLIIDETDHPLIIKVASIPQTRVQVYFIDNDDYFLKRSMATDEEGKEYEDNGERAVFFARGVLETVKKLRWIPDVIHCQGWMGAIVPLYIKTALQDEPSFANARVVTSLFKEDLKGKMSDKFKASLPFRTTTSEILKDYKEDFDYEDLMKLAIDYSDGIVEAEKGVDKKLLKYATEMGKKVMKYPGKDNFADAYDKFYDSIL